jgi:hypothetical protein
LSKEDKTPFFVGHLQGRIPHAFTLWNFAFGEPAAGGIPQGKSASELLQYSKTRFE